MRDLTYTPNRKDNTIVVSGRMNSPKRAVYALVADESDARHGEYVKLLASMDVLRAATVAFGSYRTNPGMFLGMCMGTRFIGIDSDEWVLW